MKTSAFKSFSCAFVMLCLSAQIAFAQGPQGRPLGNQRTVPRTASPAPSAPSIAVIDISFIFKNHDGYKQQMEAMKKDVQAFEAYLKQKGASLQQQRERMQEYRVGTPDYKNSEAQIAKFQADVTAETQIKRNDFLEREAKIYYSVYQQIEKHVSDYCRRFGISLVVRFNSEPIDPALRKSVIEGVNRPVVFYQPNTDITKRILDSVNRAQAAVATRPQPPTRRGEPAPRRQ